MTKYAWVALGRSALSIVFAVGAVWLMVVDHDGWVLPLLLLTYLAAPDMPEQNKHNQEEE